MGPRTPLTSPSQYFSTSRGPLVPGLAVFAGYALGQVVAVYLVARWLLATVEGLPPEVPSMLPSMLPGLLVGMLIVATVALFVVATIMHFGVGSSASGSFTEALAVAAWAYAPNLLVIPLELAWIRYQLQGLTIEAESPAAFEAAIDGYLESMSTVPDLVMSLAVIGWSVWILAWGVTSTHEVDFSRALFPAAIVGVGALLLIVLA